MASVILAKSFSFSALSLPLTRTSTGNRPPLIWSRYLAARRRGSATASFERKGAIGSARAKPTFLLGGEDVECVEGEEHERRGELVAKQPELEKEKRSFCQRCATARVQWRQWSRRAIDGDRAGQEEHLHASRYSCRTQAPPRPCPSG